MKCCNRMKCKMNCYLYDKPFLKKKLCAIRRSWVEVYHILNTKCRCPGGDPHGCCSGK